MANRDVAELEERQPESGDQSDNNGYHQPKGKMLLDYTLKPMVNSAVFAVHYIGNDLYNYLASHGTFTASNGIRIQLSPIFSEWKESENLIRLSRNQYDRPDITFFASFGLKGREIIKGSQIRRNNKVAAVNEALKELVNFIVEYYGEPIVESKIRNDGRVRLS